MGLDITAYSRLVEEANPELEEDGQLVDENLIRLWENPDFQGRLDGLKGNGVYRTSGECGGFRAGSYGGYTAWREELARIAGYEPGQIEIHGKPRSSYCAKPWAGASGPFSEQINFSDCEGTIGPVVSAKLAKDYAEFLPFAEAVGGRFLELYLDWKSAFELAADQGAVIFH